MVWLLALACAKLPTSFTSEAQSLVSEDGYVGVVVPADGDMRSFLLTAETEQGWLAVEEVWDPYDEVVLHWEDWYTSDRSLTGAFWADAHDLVFNWPVRKADGDLDAGDWIVWVSATDDNGVYLDGEDIEIQLSSKVDDHLKEAVIKVTIGYTGDLDQDPDIVAAVEAAVARWEEVWAPYDLAIELRYETLDLPADIDSTAGTALAEATAHLDDDDMLMLIGEQIDGDGDTYGFAGSIPGTLISTGRAAVYMSWLASAGRDGEFSPAEIDLMGETMAHEVGHYTGVFHPVEFGYRSWDSLDDTPECMNAASCEGDMGDNLMFPYPVCDRSSCVPTDQLTKGQRAITNLWTGAL